MQSIKIDEKIATMLVELIQFLIGQPKLLWIEAEFAGIQSANTVWNYLSKNQSRNLVKIV